MKKVNLTLILSIFSIFLGCSNSDNNANPNNPSNDYINYDFYISEGSRGGNNGGISKNFNPLSGYERNAAFYEDDPLGFKIYGNNIYTYGSKKYRTLTINSPGYYEGVNYSGFLSKNNTIQYSDLGGGSSTITSMIEVGTDAYFCTGYKFFDGGQSIDQAVQIGLASKVYKNGILLYNLQSPFNNWFYSQGQVVNNNYSLTYVNNIVVKGSDIYVAGFCLDYHNNSRVHYGYWRNGIFNDIYNDVYNVTNFNPKLIVSDAGVTYLGFSKDGKKHLFMNNTNIKSIEDVFFKDFGLLGNDLYSLGSFYDNSANSYKLGIYKNGLIIGSATLNNSFSYYSDQKIEIIDNKIFICGSGINNESNVAVFEYKIDSNTFIKVGTSKYEYADDYKIISGFQVVKN